MSKKMTGYPSIDKPWLKYYPEEAKNTQFPKMNMKDYLFERNEERLDFFALNYYGRRITYRELFAQINKAQICFAEMGVRQNDVVSIAAPFFPETIIAIYAINALGAVVNIVDPRVPEDKLLNYLIGSKSKYLIAIDVCYKKIKRIKDKANQNAVILISPLYYLPAVKKRLAILSGKKTIKNLDDGFYYWNEVIGPGQKNKSVSNAPYQEETPAIIIYTSGTSGEPKGAIASNETFNNIACSQSFSLCDTKPGDKFLLIMPPFIAYGLAIGMHGQLCRGQELIMIPTFNIDNQQKLLGDLVSKYKPQTIMGVPAFMADLIKHPKMQKMNCSFLKTVIVGGDSMVPPSEVAVNTFLSEHNSTARICKGWGLTEVNSAFSYTKDVSNNKIGSVGVPLLGNNIKVFDPIYSDDIDFDSLHELPYEETGELFINSKSTIIDYLNNPEESKRVFFTSKSTGETWIRTKDLGRVTKDGVIYIEGRMKRIIIRPDGHNISPFAIETIINSFDCVEGCAVIGKKQKGQLHGAYAVALIQLKPDAKDDKSTIISRIRNTVEQKLPPRDIPSEYCIVAEIPLTPIGKIDYRALEKEVE